MNGKLLVAQRLWARMVTTAAKSMARPAAIAIGTCDEPSHLLMLVLIILVMLPFFGPLFFVVIKAFAHGAAHGALSPADIPALSGMAILGIMLGVIPMTYLSISWVFALALVIDQGLGPWTAMEVSRRVVGRRWFSMFGLVICAGILALLGVIGLFIGVFFTIPLAYGSILYAYEDLCAQPAKSS